MDGIAILGKADGRRAVLVGDVAGHGGGVSDEAKTLHIYLRSLINDDYGPERALEACNTYFSTSIALRNVPIAALFVALVDLHAQTLTYACAGHETALLFDAQSNHEHLPFDGPLLGLFGGYDNIYRAHDPFS